MNNSFADVYPQLADHLAAAVPGLGWIDLDQGQLDNDANEYPLNYDAGVVLIDFEEIDWEELGGGYQRGDAVIKFTLARRVTEDTYQHSSQRGAALEHLKQLGQLHKALTHHEGGGYGALVRTRSAKEQPRPGLWVYSMSYRSRLFDAQGAPADGGEVSDLDTIPRGDFIIP